MKITLLSLIRILFFAGGREVARAVWSGLPDRRVQGAAGIKPGREAVLGIPQGSSLFISGLFVYLVLFGSVA